MIQLKWKSIIIYVLIILVGISAALILYFYQMFYKSQQFLPGVYISNVNISGYDQQGATDLLQAEMEQLSHIPCSFNFQDYTYETKMGDLVQLPDARKVVLDVWDQEKQRSLLSKLFNLDGSEIIKYPLNITYDDQKLARIGDEWKENLDKDYVNARLEIDPGRGLIVTPSSKGYKVDLALTWQTLPAEWQQLEKYDFEIVVKQEAPRISENDLKNMGEIASFGTWYNANQVDRSHNLILASRALNTNMVAPGEVFSFNKTVGPRVHETGYRDAMIIIGDKFEPGLGGGICQVSSTLYNACLLAGLKIVERHNHNLAVAYVPLGQDATVSYGLQDFRFKNNYNEPVYLWAQAAHGKVTVKIYGNLKYKQKIQVSHIVDQVIDFQEIRETKEDLKPGTTKVEQNGSPGYVVRSFRTFYNSDGSIARQEQLARDRYRPLNRLVYEGPEDGQPASEDPDSETDPSQPETPEDEGPEGTVEKETSETTDHTRG